jgi:transposase
MDMTGKIVGIDVSKDRLDVHVLPQRAQFVVARDGKGLADLAERLLAERVALIALEATGGLESVAAAGIRIGVHNVCTRRMTSAARCACMCVPRR